MENSKFLKIVIIILLLINISTLAFMWMHKGPPGVPTHERVDVKDFLVHELNLTALQQNQFEELKKQHHEAVEKLQHQSRNAHDNYFNLLGNPQADSLMVSQAADSILAIQKQIELLTFYHFNDVRAICTPEQQHKFDEVISDALRMMGPPPHP